MSDKCWQALSGASGKIRPAAYEDVEVSKKRGMLWLLFMIASFALVALLFVYFNAHRGTLSKQLLLPPGETLEARFAKVTKLFTDVQDPDSDIEPSSVLCACPKPTKMTALAYKVDWSSDSLFPANIVTQGVLQLPPASTVDRKVTLASCTDAVDPSKCSENCDNDPSEPPAEYEFKAEHQALCPDILHKFTSSFYKRPFPMDFGREQELREHFSETYMTECEDFFDDEVQAAYISDKLLTPSGAVTLVGFWEAVYKAMEEDKWCEVSPEEWPQDQIDKAYAMHFELCAPTKCTYLKLETTVDVLLKAVAQWGPISAIFMGVAGFIYGKVMDRVTHSERANKANASEKYQEQDEQPPAAVTIRVGTKQNMPEVVS